ncbi:MAG: phenylalanine--tRNA ligase subunit alpha [Candidatus Absconditabacteria bacterium]|nr:phenylalanine--tRNA ligase subunit alpha [Candidatus Absconditabacteria bacterium]
MFDYKGALKELETIQTLEQLEEVFQKYLGKQGSLTLAFKEMASLSPEEKKEAGKTLSEAKTLLNEAYEAKLQELSIYQINESLNKDLVDFSLEKSPYNIGHRSLLAEVRREAEEVCKSMGFIIEYGTDVVTKFENFESVNIPLSHPATEMQDTIYLKETDPRGEPLILRTQTSSMQNFMIKKYGVPLKAVVPGKVYRYENMDATHDTMFYQLEGIVVDKGVTIAHAKHMIEKLLSAILKKDVETRMRPGYFPFVEPGFEIDARYEITDPKTGKKTMSKWMELLGAGMIHPKVLEMAGVDPKEYSGFAFGMGLSRLAAVRYGIKDIRYFTNGDLRFAQSF